MKKLERIILVDDDADTNFYNEMKLSQLNAAEHIIAFQSAKEALEFLRAGNLKVDLILLDLNMPIMDGWQFLEHYKQLDAQKKASALIVMLTSTINMNDIKKAETNSLINKFINKPLNEKSINDIMSLFN